MIYLLNGTVSLSIFKLACPDLYSCGVVYVVFEAYSDVGARGEFKQVYPSDLENDAMVEPLRPKTSLQPMIQSTYQSGPTPRLSLGNTRTDLAASWVAQGFSPSPSDRRKSRVIVPPSSRSRWSESDDGMANIVAKKSFVDMDESYGSSKSTASETLYSVPLSADRSREEIPPVPSLDFRKFNVLSAYTSGPPKPRASSAKTRSIGAAKKRRGEVFRDSDAFVSDLSIQVARSRGSSFSNHSTDYHGISTLSFSNSFIFHFQRTKERRCRHLSTVSMAHSFAL